MLDWLDVLEGISEIILLPDWVWRWRTLWIFLGICAVIAIGCFFFA